MNTKTIRTTALQLLLAAAAIAPMHSTQAHGNRRSPATDGTGHCDSLEALQE
jgi:hypothetical protein